MPSDLPRAYRPLGARIAAAAVGVVLLVVVVLMWIGLPEEVRADFTPLQVITLLGVLGCILTALYGVFRTVVRANHDGLTVINLYRRRDLEWPAVVAVNLRPGQPWAVLDVSDGTTVAAMAIQGSDGQRAVRAVRELSALVAEHSATERND
jgi:hypothetical protein